MNCSHLTLGLTLLLSLWLPSTLTKAATQAMNKQTSETSQGDDLPLLDDAQEETLDEMKDLASTKLLEAAEWIDSFFDDSRSTLEDNQTRGTIKLSAGYSRKNELEFKPRFSLRLKLPRLSSRALLIIQGSDDQDFDTESNPVDNRSPHEDSKFNDVTVGIRSFLLEADKYNLSVDGGASWDYLYAGFRFRSLQELGDWQGRFTNRLRYYTDDGWEDISTYDFETYWGEKWMFRTTSTLVLSEKETGIPHSQYFKLYQVLNEYQAISYESGIYLDTEPDYLVTDIQFIVRHRQRFYRDWLVLEIAPIITFPEEDDYDINPGIMFKFEATIGYKTDKDVYKKIFREMDKNKN